jgi:hydrogenase maturation protease
MTTEPKVLLIGFGNPGRCDDALGPALAEAVEAMDFEHVTVDSDYQLTVEDGAEAARYDVVIFADADTAGPEPFSFRPIRIVPQKVSFSSHSCSPEGVMALTRELFGATPEGWILGIRGYAFNEFGERMSDRAGQNLQQAVTFIRDVLTTNRYRAVRDEGRPDPPGATSE